MAKKWDPTKGQWTITQVVKRKLQEAGSDGIPIADLIIALRRDGYYIPNKQYMINMFSTLKLTLEPDGYTVRLK